MSAATYIYQEPHRFRAGVGALLVHGVFFALLYFGISWHTEQPQGMVVDIWDSLPEEKVAPVKRVEPVKPLEPVKPPEPERPVVQPKADINLAKKKVPEIKPVEIKKPVEIRKPVEIKKPVEGPQGEEARPAQPSAEEIERAKQMAQAQSAITSEIGKYKGLISSKIRRNVVMPPDVPFGVKAEFDVVLIPGGSVLSERLSKTSGNSAYDSAVERAILKAQPLPLPPDVGMFNYFRELHLSFCPERDPCN
ncbi:MAG: cell envelope integrity protein TolA [Gallionellaceae bacterium]